MDYSSAMTSEPSSLKRPRSLSGDNPLPAAKVPRTTTNHLQINYLARQHQETIPLVTVNEKLPEIARLLGEYDGVLQRHESMAGNLGACPLGPILLKRFERLFDGPPRVLKSHAKDANVTWLDVVEFAQSKPEQFNLERMRNGVRVCQFYTKGCRVEISEEDFVLVASGMPQKLIPPQPILEDEEKELGIMELLDRNLGQVIQLADQVSARARQLIHKMKNRRAAILSRREQDLESRRGPVPSTGSPLSPIETNGLSSKPVKSIERSQSPPTGFMAVNVRHSIPAEGELRTETAEPARVPPEEMFSSSGQNVTIINGKSIKDASPTVRAELLKQFLTASDREAGLTDDGVRRSSFGPARTGAVQPVVPDGKPRSNSMEMVGVNVAKHPSTVPIPHTPASLMPHVKQSVVERDDGGPFKSEMVSRMESMRRGERVLPPCDRCRRLHMDCLKNLTACMGCTRKHAKCSWKDVRAEELRETASTLEGQDGFAKDKAAPPSAGSTIEVARTADEPSRPQTAISSTSSDVTRRDGITTAKDESRTTVEPVAATGPGGAAFSSATTSSPPPPRAEPAGMTARFDVRPPPIGQHLPPDAATKGGRSPPAPSSSPSSRLDSRKSNHPNDNDEGDRLQALAAQVYRSASQNVRSQEG